MDVPSQTAGSPLWQNVFISFAVVLILFQVLRGWRLGLMRQLMRLAAIVGAYAAAYLGGRALVPLVRDSIRAPDLVLSSLAGALLALIVYSVVTAAGAFLFKRTAQHPSALIRLVWGCSGAFLGIFFGLFFVWLVLLGVRSVGALAEAQVRAQTARSSGLALAARRAFRAESDQPEPSLTLLARLKNSVELGSLGKVVRQADVLPGGAYQTLGKAGEVFAQPESAQRFFTYPGARKLSEHPKIVALTHDPEIAQMLQEGRIIDLVQDRRLIDALNDPTLLEQVKQIDFARALDYALEKN